MKITYLAAISSDGFIARDDGDVSWLDDVEMDESDDTLEKFFAAVDGLVMGRASYDFVFNYGSWPYEDKLSWVCTSRDLEVLEGANLRAVDSVEKVMAEARAENKQHLWLIGGGQLASALVEKQLLTHISLTVIPVALGSGISLFARHDFRELPARHKETLQKKGFERLEIVLDYE